MHGRTNDIVMRTEGFNDRLVLVGLESLDDDLHGSVNGAMKREA